MKLLVCMHGIVLIRIRQHTKHNMENPEKRFAEKIFFCCSSYYEICHYPGIQVGLPDMGCCKRSFGIILLSGPIYQIRTAQPENYAAGKRL